MKGKRYTTEDKIRILREVEGGKSVQEVCREKNIAEHTFYRWKRVLAQRSSYNRGRISPKVMSGLSVMGGSVGLVHWIRKLLPLVLPPDQRDEVP